MKKENLQRDKEIYTRVTIKRLIINKGTWFFPCQKKKGVNANFNSGKQKVKNSWIKGCFCHFGKLDII